MSFVLFHYHNLVIFQFCQDGVAFLRLFLHKHFTDAIFQMLLYGASEWTSTKLLVVALFCNELLGCDIRTEEGIAYARENDLFTDFCPKMVANAVDVLEEIIQNNGEKE